MRESPLSGGFFPYAGDLRLPKPDGTAAIALTADAVVGARESYLNAGFQGYRSKPIEAAEREETLSRHPPDGAKGRQGGVRACLTALFAHK